MINQNIANIFSISPIFFCKNYVIPRFLYPYLNLNDISAIYSDFLILERKLQAASYGRQTLNDD